MLALANRKVVDQSRKEVKPLGFPLMWCGIVRGAVRHEAVQIGGMVQARAAWAAAISLIVAGFGFSPAAVGSEVWVGVADHPAGPWHDAHGGKPLIPGNYRPGFHMIDAEAFIDDDGQTYLYWGSGLNWVNGHCFVVKLKPDMVSFDGEP